MVKKPEKKTICDHPNMRKMFREEIGYNKACDDWEAYHKDSEEGLWKMLGNANEDYKKLNKWILER